ncbi:MAG: phytanoyl-CoA dioxygenase family protein [Pseudomonadales bacterium]
MNAIDLNDIELAAFQRDGFLIRKGMTDESVCNDLQAIAQRHVAQQLAPIEYEVDVQYPGSPAGLNAEGADTSRRLLQAYSRHETFREWASSRAVRSVLAQLFGSDSIMLSQCHHNCIMTKRAGYSSATLWHQDNRYWSFDEENLISVWLALGDEVPANGCLKVIPGSHVEDYAPGRFDASLFFRTDLDENKALIARSINVSLDKGDVLFFHSRLIHAAGRNQMDKTKYSLVYTYHQYTNHPIRGTRSARYPSVELSIG